MSKPGGGWWLPALFLMEALAGGSVQVQSTQGSLRDFTLPDVIVRWAFIAVVLFDIWGPSRKILLGIAWTIGLGGAVFPFLGVEGPGVKAAAVVLTCASVIASFQINGYLGGVVRRRTQVGYTIWGSLFFSVVMIAGYGLFPLLFGSDAQVSFYVLCLVALPLLPILHRTLPERLAEEAPRGRRALDALYESLRAVVHLRTAWVLPSEEPGAGHCPARRLVQHRGATLRDLQRVALR